MAAEGVKNESHVSEMPPDIPSTQRVTRVIPSEWLDRLIEAHCEIEPGAPLDTALASLLSVAREVLLGVVAIGARVPDHGGHQLVVRVGERTSQVGSSDPARLFPEIEDEVTFDIPNEPGATLFVAVDDRARLLHGGAPHLFVQRVARVLASVIRTSRALERTPAQEVLYLRDQMIQLDRLGSVGQMVTSIVHELNNPLTLIIALADLLRKRAIDPVDVERLYRIIEAAERIRRFSRDLTEYASPREAARTTVAIERVINQALLFCEHELDRSGVAVEREFGPVMPVHGVPDQLTQVFVNLFTNAAHAMTAQGGTLVISTRMTADGGVEIAVRDDGRGIDAAALARVFEPFFTTKQDGTGTGLGLSIVKRIVTAHDGQIRAEPNTPRGTVFFVDLPAARPELVEQTDL